MVTALTHGISSMIDNAEGAIVQSAEITEKTEKSLVSGMVSGVTQIVKVFSHTKTKPFSVSGKGDLTLVTGKSTTVSDAHFSAAFISGGLIHLDEIKYSQKIGEPSDWSYQGEHYPSAA